MNNFENLKSLSLESLAMWLYKNCQFEDSPWTNWFDDTFCGKCEPIEVAYAEYWNNDPEPYSTSTVECAYCEHEDKCRYFPDEEEIPDELEIIKLWLRQEM